MTRVSCRFARQSLLISISRELAQASGIGRRRDLVLLLNFALVFALGVKLVGTPLPGAPTILRARIAKAIGIFAGALAWTAAQGSREARTAPVAARRAERA